MNEHFDELETRDLQEREETLFARLPSFIERAIKVAPGWKKRLAGVDPLRIMSREALARLPVLRLVAVRPVPYLVHAERATSCHAVLGCWRRCSA